MVKEIFFLAQKREKKFGGGNLLFVGRGNLLFGIEIHKKLLSTVKEFFRQKRWWQKCWLSIFFLGQAVCRGWKFAVWDKISQKIIIDS